MYKITNKMKDARKFRDKFLGKDVIVEPKQSVIAKKRIEENDVWKVEKLEKKKIKKNKKIINGDDK